MLILTCVKDWVKCYTIFSRSSRYGGFLHSCKRRDQHYNKTVINCVHWNETVTFLKAFCTFTLTLMWISFFSLAAFTMRWRVRRQDLCSFRWYSVVLFSFASSPLIFFICSRHLLSTDPLGDSVGHIALSYSYSMREILSMHTEFSLLTCVRVLKK